MLVVFVLEIVMRNSVTRNTERVRITNAYWNDSCQTKQMKKWKADSNCERLGVYLKVLSLYTKWEELPLVKYIPSNNVRGMFELHDRLSSRLIGWLSL